MPTYIFQHPETDEVVEVVQKIKEPHVFIDKNGVEWNRIFTVPHASVPVSIDAYSATDFAEKTKGSKGTLGDLWDRSKEMSEKRKKDHGGIDPVEKKYYKNYSEKRKGMKHSNDPKK